MNGGGCCSEVIEPTLKLRKMLKPLKYLFFLILFLILLDMFFIKTSFFFDFTIEELLLLIVFSTKHYSHMLLFLIACIISMVSLIEFLGIWFQHGFYKSQNPYQFGFLVFELVLQTFSVFLSLQLYRQMKYEYKIKVGLAEPDEEMQREQNENIHGNELAGNNNYMGNNFMNNNFGNIENNNGNNNNYNNNDNNNHFVPFGGHGVAVGGN